MEATVSSLTLHSSVKSVSYTHLQTPDYLYNPDMEKIQRQALHSYRLAFRHPITGEDMEFTAELPEDMVRIDVYKRQPSKWYSSNPPGPP